MEKISRTILPSTLKEYNAYVRSGVAKKGIRCLKYEKDFIKAAKISGYPKTFLMGIAMHECICDPKSVDWAGGIGLMQITPLRQGKHKGKVNPKLIRKVAKTLKIKIKDVDVRRNNFHNIMAGAAELQMYETRLLSRAHGILAYNMGVGGVRRTIRKMGYNFNKFPRNLPNIKKMMRHLRYDRKMKPRVYVPKVLASVVIIDRIKNKRPLRRLKKLKPQDISGWDPMEDPWRLARK